MVVVVVALVVVFCCSSSSGSGSCSGSVSGVVVARDCVPFNAVLINGKIS